MQQYKQLLENIGLNQTQVDIVGYLLTKKKDRARNIARQIKRPRGITCHNLNHLIDLGLIIKKDKVNQVSTFSLVHPSKLYELIENKQKELKQQELSLKNALPELVSMYNLANNKPGVKFYEGIEGLKKSLQDTLNNKKETIYTYIDSFSVDKEIGDIDKEYVAKRLKKGIRKKILMADNEASREYIKTVTDDLTEIKLVKNKNIQSFYSTTQIYNNKVAFLTFKDGHIISVIISDPSIYQMHRFFFEALWNKS